jgi:hypothetical protein
MYFYSHISLFYVPTSLLVYIIVAIIYIYIIHCSLNHIIISKLVSLNKYNMAASYFNENYKLFIADRAHLSIGFCYSIGFGATNTDDNIAFL